MHERIEALSARLEESPRDMELLLRRADLYRQHEEFPAALRDIEEVERLGGRQADVLLLRGRTLLECDCGRGAEAGAALERFLDLRPEHGEGWLLLARARRDVGDHEGSVPAYTRAIAHMESAGPEVYLERADEILKGEPAGEEHVTDAALEALAGIDEGIERLGPVVTLELRAAELEIGLGRVDGALARIDAVMAQAARKEAWLARRGEILEKAGRAEEALRTYRAARHAMTERRGGERDRSLRDAIECAIERLEAENGAGVEARNASG